MADKDLKNQRKNNNVDGSSNCPQKVLKHRYKLRSKTKSLRPSAILQKQNFSMDCDKLLLYFLIYFDHECKVPYGLETNYYSISNPLAFQSHQNK